VIAKEVGEITVLDVIESVDPWRRLDRCPLGKPAHAETLCPLHRRLFEAQHMIEEALREAKLRDLIDEVSSASSDCLFPAREHSPTRSEDEAPSKKKEDEP
jgi:DNA-binding IscR family transcriptional regulator